MKIALSIENEIEIEFAHLGITTSAAVSPAGDRLFRLESVPIFVDEVTYGDVIEADIISEESLRFVRVAERGGWRIHTYVLPKNWAETEMKNITDEAVRRGGHWECVFGGVLIICLPPHCTDWDQPNYSN